MPVVAEQFEVELAAADDRDAFITLSGEGLELVRAEVIRQLVTAKLELVDTFEVLPAYLDKPDAQVALNDLLQQLNTLQGIAAMLYQLTPASPAVGGEEDDQ